MKLATVGVNGQEELALVTDHGLFAVNQLAHNGPWTIARVLEEGDTSLKYLEGLVPEAHATLQGYRFLPPWSHPEKILCVGLNYRPHVAEGHFDIPTHPVLFNKYPNALRGDGARVKAPGDARQMDYEAELVIMMGKRARNVPEDDALDYVFGYMNGNDLSARDLQFRTSQWLLGKAADGLGPVGPYVVTADSVGDPDNLEIQGFRNGELVQRSNTNQMIFSCRFLVSYISRYITLEPGDLIFTGTPEGVILGKPEGERDWLCPGDTVSVAIEGLGELTTHIG